MEMGRYAIIFTAALCAALLSTWFVRRIAIYFRAVDYPNAARKIHALPTPLWGGLAILVAWGAAAAFAFWSGFVVANADQHSVLFGFAAALVILVVGGMLDDRFSLVWWQQLIAPILATSVVVANGLSISFVTNPLGDGVVSVVRPVGVAVVVCWLIGMTYTSKLLDGIDGLASSLTFVSAVIIFAVSLSWDARLSPTSFLAIALAGSLAGFLYFNKFPARIFLGEGGSTLLGFSIAVLAVLSGSKIATALLLMGVPILDVVWILVRRLAAGQRLYVGDDKHLHFRLLRAGLSQQQIVLLYAFVALLFGSISLFFTTRAKLLGLGALIIFVSAAGYVLVKRYGRTTNS